MAKARTSPKTKAAQKRKGCARTTISFTTKRGKKVEFDGRAGQACGPRPKPKTGHLAPYKKAFAQAARDCKGDKGQRFLKCMSANTKGILLERGRSQGRRARRKRR